MHRVRVHAPGVSYTASLIRRPTHQFTVLQFSKTPGESAAVIGELYLRFQYSCRFAPREPAEGGIISDQALCGRVRLGRRDTLDEILGFIFEVQASVFTENVLDVREHFGGYTATFSLFRRFSTPAPGRKSTGSPGTTLKNRTVAGVDNPSDFRIACKLK